MPGIFRHPPQPYQLPLRAPLPALGDITGATVPTAVMWFVPVVAGPIGPGGPCTVPSAVSWNTPSLEVDIDIGPVTVPSAVTWNTPVVAFVQSIGPGGPCTVPSAVTWNTPVVAGSQQWINTTGVPSMATVPFPTVTGGVQPFIQIFIGGQDVSKYLSYTANAFKITSQTIWRWQMLCDLEVGGGIPVYVPSLGASVFVLDYGRRIFAGCVSQIIIDRRMWTATQTAIHLTATDKSAICDRRIVTGVTYPAGNDVFVTISNIATNYLNGEGILLTGVPNDGTLGALESDLVCNFCTVTQAFDSIASQTGTVWWIDPQGVLFFASLSNLAAAPFALSEITDNWRQAQGYYGLTSTLTTLDYYNKLYAVSNLAIVPGSQGAAPVTPGLTQTFTFTLNSPGIYQPQGFAAGIILSTPAGSITSLKVNGVTQTVVDFGAYSGQTPNPPDLLWFWAGPASGVPGAIVTPTILPSAGATIVVVYNPALSTSSSTAQYGTALTPVDPHGDPLGRCGSGVYEGVLQVQNITSLADLNAIAAAELARIGGVPTIVDFETDFPGLQPGQLLDVDIPLSGITDSQLLITEVQGVFIPPTLADGGSFRWQVKARNNLDPGNWAKWYERLVARTQNPLPVLQTETASFILPSGSSLSSGQGFGNPYIVNQTGQLLTLLAAAASPQTGQNLILTVSVNGTPIASLTVPNGTAANQLVAYDVPAGRNIWLFARDIVTCTATYSILSSSTTKASGLTFRVVWGTGGTGIPG